MRDANGRGISDIFGDITDALTTLVRKEIQLARAEITEKAGSIGSSLGVVGVGAILLLLAMIFVLQGVVALLVSTGLSPMAANLIVGFVVLVIGGIAVSVGLSRLRASNLVPERTIDQLQRDAAVAKDQLHLSPKHSESMS